MERWHRKSISTCFRGKDRWMFAIVFNEQQQQQHQHHLMETYFPSTVVFSCHRIKSSVLLLCYGWLMAAWSLWLRQSHTRTCKRTHNHKKGLFICGCFIQIIKDKWATDMFKFLTGCVHKHKFKKWKRYNFGKSSLSDAKSQVMNPNVSLKGCSAKGWAIWWFYSNWLYLKLLLNGFWWCF